MADLTGVPREGAEKIRVFCCCAKENRTELLALMTHTASVRSVIDVSSFETLPPGSNQREYQRDRILSCSVAIVLITADLAASPECAEQVDLILRRSADAEIELMPIYAKACSLAGTPFAELTLLPRTGVPIAQSVSPDVAWSEVADEIVARIKSVAARAVRSERPGIRPPTFGPLRTLLLLDPSESVPFREVLRAHLSSDFGVTAATVLTEHIAKQNDYTVLCVPPTGDPTRWMTFAFSLVASHDDCREGRIALLRPSSFANLFGHLPNLKIVEYDATSLIHGDQLALTEMQRSALQLASAFASSPARGGNPTRRKGATGLVGSSEPALVHASIGRLHSLIVRLRDVLIELPGKLNSSIKDAGRFRLMKQALAANVRLITAPFRVDAENCGASSQFEELVAATTTLVLNLPHPTEEFLEGKTLSEAIFDIATLSFAAAGTESSVSAGAKTAEGEVWRRVDKTVLTYVNWWSEGHARLRMATTAFLDRLQLASMDLNQTLLEARTR